MKHNKKHGNVSKGEKLWIRSIEEDLGRNIEQNKRIGQYNVDGFDNETSTVYEFNGCLGLVVSAVAPAIKSEVETVLNLLLEVPSRQCGQVPLTSVTHLCTQLV